MHDNNRAPDENMYRSGQPKAPQDGAIDSSAPSKLAEKESRPLSSVSSSNQIVGKKEALESEKFRRALIRSLNTSTKNKNEARGARYPPEPRGFRLAGTRSLVILSIIICTVLVTSAYATVAPSAFSEGLTTVMNDVLALSYNNIGTYVSPAARDSTPPKISGLTDIVVEATGLLTVVPLTEPIVTDNLDPNPAVTSDAPSAGFLLGTKGVTWTAKDAAGNTATAVQKVILVDTTAPIITAPSDFVVNVDGSTPYTQVSLGNPTVQDAVDAYPHITNDSPAAGFGVGLTTVKWKAMDASGNYATDTQTVQVTIVDGPSAPAPGKSSHTSSGSQDASSTDPSSSSNATATSPPEDPAGNTTPADTTSGSVTYSGRFGGGGGGGSSVKPSGTADISAPTIIAPSSIFANATGPLTTLVLGSPVVNDAVDPSPEVTNNAPAGGFPLGTTVVTWTATDDVGNYASVEQRIVIEDKSPPILEAPADIVAEATDVSTILSLGEPIVRDLANASVVVSNDAPLGFKLGNSTVTWTATDASGNTITAVQIVTIIDTTPPTIIAPPDEIEYVEDAAQLAIIPLGDPFVDDFADNAPEVTNDAPAGGFPLGTTVVTWTATDFGGRSASDTQLITIVVQDTQEPEDSGGSNPAGDTNSTSGTDPSPVPNPAGPGPLPDVNPPTIIAPTDVTVEATGLLTSVDLGTPTVTDLEDPSPTIINDAPADGFPVGETIVTWRATDDAGNSATATQSITVIDAGGPTIVVPTNLVAEASSTSGAIVNYIVEVFAFDGLDGPLDPVCDQLSGTMFSLGITAVTCSATDSDGNTESSTFDIVVQDTTAPSIIAPADIMTEASGALTSVEIGTAIASDTADESPTISNDVPADGFPVGNTTITWTATDASGNSATAIQIVTVIDTAGPIVSIPADLVIEATVPEGAFVNYNVSAADLADGIIVPVCMPVSGSTFPLGITTVSCSAADSDGNTGFSSFTIAVQDTTPPTIVAPPDEIEYVEDAAQLAVIPLGDPFVDDLADNAPTVENNAPSNGFAVGKTTVTWTATDDAGNSASDIQIIAVVVELITPIIGGGLPPDVNPPTIIAPTDVTVEATGLLTSVDLGTPTVTDLEDPSPTIINDAPADGFPVGETIVTWRATDAYGNSAEAEQMITIISVGYDYSPSFGANGSAYFDIPHYSTLSLEWFSVAAWFKTSANYADDGMIVNKNGVGLDSAGYNLNYGIWIDKSEKIKGGFEGADGANYFVVSNNTYNDGKWHYAVVTYDGAIVNMYIDSILIGNLSTTVTPDNGGNNDYPLRIGSNSQGNDAYFTGEIDEVRVWSRALSANETGEQYWSAIVNPEGQVAYMDGLVYNVITPTDTIPPTIVAPPDVTALATGTLTKVSLGTPTVTDIEDPSPIVTNNSPAKGFPVGKTTVIWTATDASGNSASASQTVTIGDAATAYTIPIIGGVKPTVVTYGSTVHTVCDAGCTHTSIKNAINSLPSDGGKVVLKGSKTYSPSATIYLRSNLVIEFEADTSIKYSGSGRVFSGNDITDVMFINPAISRTNAGDVIYISNADTIIIQGGKITGVKGSGSSGFACNNCKDTLVQGGIYSTFSRPIDIGTTSGKTDGTTRNVWLVENTIFDSSIECVHLNRGYDMHAIGNNVRDCANNGIDIGYNVGVEAKYNTLTHTGYGSVDNAVGFHTDSADIVILVQNIIDITGTDGISLCGSDNNYVVANKITRTGRTLAHDAGNGIEVVKCGATNQEIPEKTVIDQNELSDIYSNGIYITQTATEVRIANNVIQDYGTKAILDNSGEATITGNSIA